MGKYSRGVTLVNVQTGAIILLFAFAISLLSSNNSSALAVDPILNSIIAVTGLDQTENPEAKTGRGNTNKNKSQTTAQTSTSRFAPQVPGTSQSATYIPVITEPLTELPTIDVSDIQQQPVRMPHPGSAIVTASAVVGVRANGSVAPLQASNEGWKLFGVVWYWWLLGGGAIYYATRQLINLQRRRTATQSSIVS